MLIPAVERMILGYSLISVYVFPGSADARYIEKGGLLYIFIYKNKISLELSVAKN